MKLIVRADDVGYSKMHNQGTFRAIEQGIVTAADMMLDTPGTEDALQYLKNCPWISVGWHCHFWGSPVLPKDQVPTLVAENGHFRPDLSTAADVSFDEALAELRAQLFRCIDILGYAPEYREFTFPADKPFGKAMAIVEKEFSIATHYTQRALANPFKDLKLPPEALPADGKMPELVNDVDEKWADKKIFDSILMLFPPMGDSIGEALTYDPVGSFLRESEKFRDFPDDYTWFTAWHPGYVDHYVLKEGDHSIFYKQYLLNRPVDVEALCDPRMKDWIIQNQVELVSFHDAMFGTRRYQNHLRAVGSSLAIG